MSNKNFVTRGRIVMAVILNSLGRAVERPAIVTVAESQDAISATVFPAGDDLVGQLSQQNLTYEEPVADAALQPGIWYWPKHATLIKSPEPKAAPAVAMRAKLKLHKVNRQGEGDTAVEELKFFAVCGKQGADHVDEDNDYARYTPAAMLEMHLNNPALVGKFKEGETFYVDFTPVTEK